MSIDEDFSQVLRGNFVTKVVYLPDAEYQELAVAGVETLVSTRLDPGVDPVVEADRRGSILAIVRIGNKDLQTSSGASFAGGDGMSGGGAVPVGYMMPMGMPAGGNPGMVPPAFVAGATAPQYGMPITGTPIEEGWDTDAYGDDDVVALYKGKPFEGHKNNFYRCIREGGLPVSDVYSHVIAMNTCHLTAIAARLGRTIHWDPATEQITGDEQAASMASRTPRAGYEIHRV